MDDPKYILPAHQGLLGDPWMTELASGPSNLAKKTSAVTRLDFDHLFDFVYNYKVRRDFLFRR